jgi:prephenate dehydrogenase
MMSDDKIRRVVIIGVGLIGGSFALAMKSLEEPPEVRGIDTSAESLEWALANGVLDRASHADDPLATEWLSRGGSDLVVVATPATHTIEWLSRLGKAGFDGIVTDVASTKSAVLAAAQSLLVDPSRYVGGHPMAGSERSGVTAARADLFVGAYWLLTPSKGTEADAFRTVHALV